MSTEQSPALAALGDSMSIDPNSQPRKSYRRKYRKIMVKFEERMRESTSLFKDEQRIFDISQRLAEQTDQILQLLLELNESPEVPPPLRFDLEPAGKETVVPSEKQVTEQKAHEDLRLGRYQIQKGDQTIEQYRDNKKEILDSIQFAPSDSYTGLLKSTKELATAYDSSKQPLASPGAAFLTIRQEEQYLQSLDGFIAGKNSNPRSHAANNLGAKSAERTTDREREMQLRNPVSVYNWLRKHQPQVFLQDHESSNDKGSKISGSRSSKRNAMGKDSKQENDYYDDEGIALDSGSVSTGKRKRGDDKDKTFRPKGGKPGHGAKRRKDDSGKRSKRSSMDARSL